MAVLTISDGVLPFVKAKFKIVPVAFSFTLTLNFNSTDFPAKISAYHFNPTTVSFSLIIFTSLEALFSTYVVFSGILSDTSIPFRSSSELFVAISVYSISSPCVAKFEPFFVVVFFSIVIYDFFESIFANAD